MKYEIRITLDHVAAAEEYTAATGEEWPRIPKGKNTVWKHFTTRAGKHAVIVNQRGFEPAAEDNEQQVNGCSLAVLLDDVPAAAARAALEEWVKEILELK